MKKKYVSIFGLDFLIRTPCTSTVDSFKQIKKSAIYTFNSTFVVYTVLLFLCKFIDVFVFVIQRGEHGP